MRDDGFKFKTFTRRSLILGSIKLLLLTTISSRYYYLQGIKGNKYSTLSEKNRVKFAVLPPIRGKILDRHGNEIASNTTHFKLAVDSLSIKELDHIIPKVEQILNKSIGLSKDDIKKMLKKRNPNDYLFLKENMSWDDVAKLTEQDYEVSGIEIIQATHRYYPEGEAFAHITGYIGSISEEDLAKRDIPNSNQIRIGKSGVEAIFDKSLLGTPGYRRTEVDVKGRYVRTLSVDETIAGDNLNLTIDHELQSFIHKLLTLKRLDGAVVVIDLETGGILTLHSTPSFDPNEFVDGVSKDYWNRIIKQSSYPLLNNAITSQYPPGSTFKIVTALAVLESGISPEQTVHCNGYFNFGSRTFKCWKSSGHGSVNLTTAIAQSCNPYFYHMGHQIGIKKIAETARKLGLGGKTGVELNSESSGNVPDPDWKKKRKKLDWYPGDTVNASIGQGFLLVTPIQLATMTARIASGKVIKPSLIASHEGDFEQLDISEKSLEIVRLGMQMSTNSPIGVVTSKQLSYGDFIVCGKTGTAQVASMKFKHLGHQFKHHALFTSFAPYDDPKYAVSVVIEHGEAGGRTAAPIAKDIYRKIIGAPTSLDAPAENS